MNTKNLLREQCSKCGEYFECGFKAGQKNCWCQQFPAQQPLPDASAHCYCPQCLPVVKQHEDQKRNVAEPG